MGKKKSRLKSFLVGSTLLGLVASIPIGAWNYKYFQKFNSDKFTQEYISAKKHDINTVYDRKSRRVAKRD